MTTPTDDLGVITVLLERLEQQRLPTALAIKAKVDRGERLDQYDIDFFKEVFEDAQRILPKLHNHPEHQELVGRLTHLYHEIIEQGVVDIDPRFKEQDKPQEPDADDPRFKPLPSDAD